MHPTAELFTEKAWAVIVAAQQLAQQRRQQQMESEHLFAALLAQQGLAGRILEKAGLDGRWTLILLIPVVNVVMIWLFAFCEWPLLPKHRQSD